jgi:1-acyl-sn-glycerol-3-phosphate acyltransferase
VLATELVFNNPLTRPMVTQAGMIPAGFQRPSPESVRPTLETVEGGGIVFIYPEGDAQAIGDGAPRPFRPGLAWLLRREPVRVVPFAHHDSRRVGKGAFFPAARGALLAPFKWPDVTFVVGKPIEPEEFADLTARDLTQMVSDRLCQTWEQARDHRQA